MEGVVVLLIDHDHDHHLGLNHMLGEEGGDNGSFEVSITVIAP